MAKREIEETGLPPLPKNHFWQVGNHRAAPGQVCLMIRRKRWGGLISTTEQWRGVRRQEEAVSCGGWGRAVIALRWTDSPGVIQKSVRDAAKEMLHRFDQSRAWAQLREDNQRRFSGNYPPKRLTPTSEQDNN